MVTPTTTPSSPTLIHLSQLPTSNACVCRTMVASVLAILPLILQEIARGTLFQVSNLSFLWGTQLVQDGHCVVTSQASARQALSLTRVLIHVSQQVSTSTLCIISKAKACLINTSQNTKPVMQPTDSQPKAQSTVSIVLNKTVSSGPPMVRSIKANPIT